MSSTSAAGEGMPSAPTPGSRILAQLQRVGLSLMLPIAVLPAAALLLRFGADDMLGRFSALSGVAGVLAAAGGALFDHLPILFAVGVAIGFARKADGSTALAAVVGYLVFDRVSMTMFAESNPSIESQVLAEIDGEQTLNLAAGNPSGVLGGIVIGLTAAFLWQRYYRVRLPQWLAFFGGRRFVPIITAFAAVLLGVVFGFVWPPIGAALQNFSEFLSTISALGAGVYGVINRLLIPFGLHHILNNFLWFQLGSCEGGSTHGDLNCYFAGQEGTGTYMAGFFPIMMFALPAAALAMTHAAKTHRRKAVGGFMFSVALTSLITGVTEPIEYSFMFIAPVLYAVHAVLTGVSMAVAAMLNIKIGFGFSAGLIDYLLNFSKSNTHNPLLILLMGAVYAVIYYFLFRALIRWLNIPTPGREPDDEAVTEGAPAEAATGATPTGNEPRREDESTTGRTSNPPGRDG